MVKNLIIKPISSKDAKRMVKQYHYSGKTVPNSQIHFGVFKDDRLVGALQFGPSTDKRRMGKSLGIGMNESLELNRMAISDECGKNTESRVISVALRILKKKYPFLRCIISFADACQCGDGIIYRASNFRLNNYKKNTSLLMTPDGEVVSDKTFNNHILNKYKGYKKSDCEKLIGFQMKYIYYYDKTLEKRHGNVPFSEIPNKIKMYKGIKRVEHEINAFTNQVREGGEVPTDTLQLKEAKE